MLKRLFASVALLSFLCVGAPAWADEYTDTINVFKKAVQSSAFFNNSYGYAVFPTIGKGGAGVGGAYGKGRVYNNALGHDTTALADPQLHEWLRRGVEWAATGKVADASK